jgi:hypothetical protein
MRHVLAVLLWCVAFVALMFSFAHAADMGMAIAPGSILNSHCPIKDKL